MDALTKGRQAAQAADSAARMGNRPAAQAALRKAEAAFREAKSSRERRMLQQCVNDAREAVNHR